VAHVRKPVWKTSSFLVYTGGLTVLGAAVAALSYLSVQNGKGALTAWALLLLLVLWLIAELLRRRDRWVAAGIFAFASVIAWGLFVGTAWSWFGWLDHWKSAFGGWSVAHLSLEFLVLVAAVHDRRRWDFPFITLITAVAAWFFVTDFVSNGGTWSYVVTLIVGLAYLLVGAVGDSPSAFWWQFVAGVLIGVPLLHWWHTTDLQWALVSAAALAYVVIAYATGRSSWAVFATIAFFGATNHYLRGSPRGLVGGRLGFGGGTECVTTPSGPGPICTSVGHTAVAPWAPALAFGLLGFWLVLLGLLGRRRRAGGEPAPV
jgi:hypothetical protein